MIIFIFLILLLICPQAGWAQTEDIIEDRLEERIGEEKGKALTGAEELIEQLKKKALRKIEEERKRQFWATKGTLGIHLGHDNNVNTDSDRRGDFYIEQYFAYSWVPTFNDYFAADIGAWYYSDWYCDNRDTTIIDNAFKASLKVYPFGGPSLELEPGAERSYVYYPEATHSSYVDDKLFFKFKHKFWTKWSHDGKYEVSYKEYDTKMPRVYRSTSYVSSMVVEKTRQTAEYNLGFPIGANNLKIKTKAYKESSNDHYIEDYYDVFAYKITGEWGRSITKKLYAKLSYAFERKNYRHRLVTAYQIAQYDDIWTRKLYLYYTLKKDWTLSYTFTHTTSDSNYVIYDYDSNSHLLGIYIGF